MVSVHCFVGWSARLSDFWRLSDGSIVLVRGAVNQQVNAEDSAPLWMQPAPATPRTTKTNKGNPFQRGWHEALQLPPYRRQMIRSIDSEGIYILWFYIFAAWIGCHILDNHQPGGFRERKLTRKEMSQLISPIIVAQIMGILNFIIFISIVHRGFNHVTRQFGLEYSTDARTLLTLSKNFGSSPHFSSLHTVAHCVPLKNYERSLQPLMIVFRVYASRLLGDQIRPSWLHEAPPGVEAEWQPMFHRLSFNTSNTESKISLC
jgi:hypothetical protein